MIHAVGILEFIRKLRQILFYLRGGKIQQMCIRDSHCTVSNGQRGYVSCLFTEIEETGFCVRIILINLILAGRAY